MKPCDFIPDNLVTRVGDRIGAEGVLLTFSGEDTHNRANVAWLRPGKPYVERDVHRNKLIFLRAASLEDVDQALKLDA